LDNATDFHKTTQPLIRFTYSYRFIVTATDEGTPRLSSAVNVSIYVDDVNDVPPMFDVELYTFGTYENQDSGTEIGSVVATDGDSTEQFSRIDYSLFEEAAGGSAGGSAGSFVINSTTGMICSVRYMSIYLSAP